LIALLGIRVADAENSTTIYVVRRSWHIDIGFAVQALHAPLDRVTAKFPGARYLFFGFGDRRYLEAKHHTVPVLISALRSGAGLVLVSALGSTPQEGFGADQVIELPVTEAAALDIEAFVAKSMDLDTKLPGPYEGSLYFNAIPMYSAAHTCNTWAAEGLKAGGLPIHSDGVVFAGQLWEQVQRLKRKLPVRDQVQGGLVPSWQTTYSMRDGASSRPSGRLRVSGAHWRQITAPLASTATQAPKAVRAPNSATMMGSRKVLIADPIRLAAIASPIPEARRSVGKSSGKYT
jgi:hypothetical protein